MTIRVVVLGGPGGGQVVAESVKRLQTSEGTHELIGFLNDHLPTGSRELGAPVLGMLNSWSDLPPDLHFIAPLHKVKEMPWRARRIGSLEIPKQRWVNIIDPHACVASTANVKGHGVHVDALATVQPGVCIGMHVAVRAGAVVGHDAALGDFCFIGANASVAGYVRLEDGVHIANNACVRERVSIGRYAVIGLGAVVVQDVPAGTVVAGNPARQVGTVDPCDATSDIGSDGVW
jgi:acetyltransferase EpsM